MRSLRRFLTRLFNSATRRAQEERLREEIGFWFRGRIAPRNFGEPGAGFHCVSSNSLRSAGIGWCCSSDQRNARCRSIL